jgi:hypothetical protein
VPTDKGYRLFVDRLSQVKALTSPERRAIETFLGGAVDVDDVVQRSVKVLAQLTNQVAIVQYPSLTRSTVRHVEVVALEGARVLVVVITSSGRVEQRIVEASYRVPGSGRITGWAALRWLGGRWFDGTGPDGSTLDVPVTMVTAHRSHTPGVRYTKERLRPDELTTSDGLTVTTAVRSVMFEARHADCLDGHGLLQRPGVPGRDQQGRRREQGVDRHPAGA